MQISVGQTDGLKSPGIAANRGRQNRRHGGVHDTVSLFNPRSVHHAEPRRAECPHRLLREQEVIELPARSEEREYLLTRGRGLLRGKEC